MLDELFEKLNADVLTEETRLQLSTIFESSLNEAIKAKELQLEEENKAEIAEFKEDMVSQIDEFLNYFVEEFVSENEELIDSHVKVKTAEKVLETFSKIVTDFNLDLSEEKIEESEQILSLKDENNKLHTKLIENKKEIDLVKKAAMIAEATHSLDTELEKEQLIEKAKTVEFDENYEGKLGVFVEQIISERSNKEKAPEKLEEVIQEVVIPKKTDDRMASYLKYL